MILRTLFGRIRRKRDVLEQLTKRDVEMLINTFTPNPDNPQARKACLFAIEVLEDIQATQLPNLPFEEDDLEKLIYLYGEAGQVTKVEQLLQKSVAAGLVPTEDVYTTVIRLQAKAGDIDNALAWFKHMEEADVWPPPSHVVEWIVAAHIQADQLNDAVQLLKTYPTHPHVVRAIARGLPVDEILNAALNRCAYSCVDRWRLNDALWFYHVKRKAGLTMRGPMRDILYKALYTNQRALAERTVESMIETQDKNSAFIAQRLMRWYIRIHDVRHAIMLWDRMLEANIDLGEQDTARLLEKVALARYHVDLGRIYRYYTKHYSATPSPDMYDKILKGFLYSKRYKETEEIYQDMKAAVEPEAIETTTYEALYGLCAQTGNVTLFHEILQTQHQIGDKPSKKALTSLMASYLVQKDLESARKVYESIHLSEEGPDIVDYNLLLRLAAMEKDKVDKVRILEILKHMTADGIQPDQTTFRTLLGVYDDQAMSKQLFKWLLERSQHLTRADNVWINNLALTLLVERCGPERAANVFLEGERLKMLRLALDDNIQIHDTQVYLFTDDMTYKILLDALVPHPQYMAIVDALFKSMRARGFKPNVELYHGMVSGWASRGRIQRARQMMQTMQQDTGVAPDVTTYTRLIEGLVRVGKKDKVPQILEEMVQREIFPDAVLSDFLNRIGIDDIV
ncbi:hypothetical protein BCR43DRAFT_502071 [Syncephalastrum racemosum]|uniref:Pentacotripeptide-repeat region of PRORP domain-containing protein n=1 Tax=Syncephalastrum racemosum TaxID=13706 RepID=A0A1X2HLR2_SYNRA|nr:hypothetical protein BCR43DRAFT_502071 [Syncephalastrum racemosum]